MPNYELIIIGAGPAGLTAALYAGRAGLKTLVLERVSPGGRILLSETIENFPGFPGGVSTQELINRMQKQVEELNVEIKLEEALELDCRQRLVKSDSSLYQARAIIFAAGSQPRRLNVPGEEKFTGKGVSYCATCDGPLYKDKEVVVVGGGDAVAEEALYLARFAKGVTVIHRREELRASSILQERLKKNNKINFILSSIVTEVCGALRVDSVKIKNVNDSQERKFPCAGVFIYIGSNPETGILRNQLQLDGSGFIIADENMATSLEGVFACGDCRKKSLYQVITACADGAQAADSAYKYLQTKGV
jgi:thioredoxin reductase (NADPH)